LAGAAPGLTAEARAAAQHIVAKQCASEGTDEGLVDDGFAALLGGRLKDRRNGELPSNVA
jgi:hypothetical protein